MWADATGAGSFWATGFSQCVGGSDLWDTCKTSVMVLIRSALTGPRACESTSSITGGVDRIAWKRKRRLWALHFRPLWSLQIPLNIIAECPQRGCTFIELMNLFPLMWGGGNASSWRRRPYANAPVPFPSFPAFCFPSFSLMLYRHFEIVSSVCCSTLIMDSRNTISKKERYQETNVVMA